MRFHRVLVGKASYLTLTQAETTNNSLIVDLFLVIFYAQP